MKKKGDERYFVLKNSPKPSLFWYKEVGVSHQSIVDVLTCEKGKFRGCIDDLSQYDIFTLSSSPSNVFKLSPIDKDSKKKEYMLHCNSPVEVSL